MFVSSCLCIAMQSTKLHAQKNPRRHTERHSFTFTKQPLAVSCCFTFIGSRHCVNQTLTTDDPEHTTVYSKTDRLKWDSITNAVTREWRSHNSPQTGMLPSCLPAFPYPAPTSGPTGERPINHMERPAGWTISQSIHSPFTSLMPFLSAGRAVNEIEVIPVDNYLKILIKRE